MSMWRLESWLAATESDGDVEPASPLRMTGGAGTAGGSGMLKGTPFSQSHKERLRGRRAMPSHEGGAFDHVAQPPSSSAITPMIGN